MNDVHVVLVTVGGLVLLLGICSSFLKARTFLTAPLISLVVGVALGPSALGVLDVARWGAPDVILEEVARQSLAIGLMAVALRLPPRYLVAQRTGVVVVLGLVMPAMWLTTALLVSLILGLPWLLALVVAAYVVSWAVAALLLHVLRPVVRRSPRWLIEGYATMLEGQLTGEDVGRHFADLLVAGLRPQS